MTHSLDADDLFIHRIQKHCAAARLNFFLVEPLWVAAFYEALNRDEVTVRVLLNMHSEHHLPEEIFHRLVALAEAKGARVIDPPSIAIAAFDKAHTHARLESAGLPVPPTVIVSASQAASFHLTDADRIRLGTPFVIKPAMGYGKRGVILDANSEADVARSMAAWKDGSYLLQKRISPKLIDGQPAYFRSYHVFGRLWHCWWNCFTDRYRALTPEETIQHGLQPLTDLTLQIAHHSKMGFFSSEIAQDEHGDFYVIDYVNDQCHMLCQSANPNIGVPDEIVCAIASELVQAAAKMIPRPGSTCASAQPTP